MKITKSDQQIKSTLLEVGGLNLKTDLSNKTQLAILLLSTKKGKSFKRGKRERMTKQKQTCCYRLRVPTQFLRSPGCPCQ